MSLFGLLSGKKEDSRGFRREMAKRLDGMAIKYVTQRRGEDEGTDGSDDYVIGRSGAIILKGRELIVYSEEKVVFRSYADRLSMSELLSGEGVILEGEDLEHGGESRKIIAYYTYYRRV